MGSVLIFCPNWKMLNPEIIPQIFYNMLSDSVLSSLTLKRFVNKLFNMCDFFCIFFLSVIILSGFANKRHFWETFLSRRQQKFEKIFQKLCGDFFQNFLAFLNRIYELYLEKCGFYWNGILLPKLWEKMVLVIENFFWDHLTRTIYSNSERSEQFLVTECFFNLFLEVSHIIKN